MPATQTSHNSKLLQWKDSQNVAFGLDAVIRLFLSDDRFVALSSRSQPEIRSFGSKRLLSTGPDVRCGCDVCLTCGRTCRSPQCDRTRTKECLKYLMGQPRPSYTAFVGATKIIIDRSHSLHRLPYMAIFRGFVSTEYLLPWSSYCMCSDKLKLAPEHIVFVSL